MESLNSLTDGRVEQGGGELLKEDERISKRSFKKDSWTWKTV